MALRPVCVDSDVLIDHLRGDSEATHLLESLEAGHLLSTTAINAFELYYGAYKTRRKEENTEAVGRLLGRLILLDVGVRVAEKAGEVAAQLEAEGVSPGFRDILIGATAVTNGCELLTRNPRHFERIPGLKLVKI
ncbi:MAG: type II toxin-antitoxin system VapC family toxin [Candidatus Bathyarchaeota archaeon]|nr:type II toxin-antitoxin system VapC family toxin [Candidatus Bathyarchaeota archaeon]